MTKHTFRIISLLFDMLSSAILEQDAETRAVVEELRTGKNSGVSPT
jgi:hypothetical protein